MFEALQLMIAFAMLVLANQR
ncbi:putative holin-like toxin [Enterococcus hirae]